MLWLLCGLCTYDTYYLGQQKKRESFSYLVPCRKHDTKENNTIVLKALYATPGVFLLLRADGPQTAFLSSHADGTYVHLSVIYIYKYIYMYICSWYYVLSTINSIVSR